MLCAALQVFFTVQVLLPRTGQPSELDALAVLAGGDGERFELALQVMRDESVPVLVVSTGDRGWPGWAEIAPFCGSTRADFEVICITADPDDTAGEATAISAIADERGWDSMALVTSDYHLHRATVRFEQCYSGRVVPLAADGDLTADLLVHEAFGTTEAVIDGLVTGRWAGTTCR